ncbi:MAG TPA: hydrolase TatD [Clostridiales bacterium]|nr:MAG: hydrolase TatD [Clostridiales bacterium GWD2_32_19]HCC06537.1 hydrolase TatD [Clostridiales bacterium]
MIFDTHAHYDDGRYNEDRDQLLGNLKDSGVELVVNCGVDIKSSTRSIKLAEKYNFIYASVGVHPHDVKSLKDEDIQVLKELAYNKRVVAIGEIGLDYYYEHSERELQKVWFDTQMKLARELNLPVIIHSRDASEETFEIIKQNNYQGLKGVIHAYSQSLEMAYEYINMGFYIGIGGVITFKNAKKLVEVVSNISIDNIVLETDCPYMTPEPNRGKRNDSTNLKYVVSKISNIKGISEEEVIKITTDNGKKLFSIHD